MKKWTKYALLSLAIGLAGYNSVYIRKLSEVQNAANAAAFDAAAYARHFLQITLPAHPDKSIDLAGLCKTLAADPARAFAESHAQNDGNNRFFMVKGVGSITRIDSESVDIRVEGVPKPISLATRYIIGTAVRDGSGLISVDDFTTTMDMNIVSEQLNNLIRTRVLPPFTAAAKPGLRVAFTAALELQKNRSIPDTLDLTPLILNIQ